MSYHRRPSARGKRRREFRSKRRGLGSRTLGARAKAGTSRAATAARKARFLDAYIANGQNGTQAAIAVGYSKKRAATAAKLLTRELAGQIEARLKELAAPHALRAEEVIAQLARMVKLDPRKLFDEHGKLRPLHEIPEDVALCLDGIEVEDLRVGKESTLRTSKFKLTRKAAAVDMAMRHFGLYPREHEAPVDPDEQAAKVRAALGDIDRLTAKRKEGK